MPKVYNKHHNDAPEGAIYVGRGSVWGNPYYIDANHSREQVLELYTSYLQARPLFRSKIKERLAGKDLICFCAPQPCHAEILMKIANEK